MDTVIQLGSFTFQNLEIPEEINFGGAHQLVQHDLIGGNRIIDALGKSDTDIQWSGLITGANSLPRAQQLNQMRAAGQQLTLTWFNLSYNVVIQNLILHTERYYQIRYEISLRVISDGANPINTQSLVSFNEAISGDLATANKIAANVGNPALTSAMTTFTTAVNAVSNFNGAAPSTIATITAPLNSAIAAAQAAIKPIAQRLFGSNT